jgi:hypothetical protein
LPVTLDKPAPYAPTASIIDVMTRSRERGLPMPVNAETLGRIGVPHSLSSRVLYALTSLDLIDENGAPTPTLESLRLAPEAEYKKRQEDWLKAAYADIFTIVDPAKDDETRVRDAFRGYSPVGQQLRIVSLFLGLCANAGMIPDKAPPSSRPRVIPRPPATTAQRQAISRVQTKIINNAKKQPASGMPPALSGLLESLPDPADGWTQADRNKFYTTFGTVLDFCIPIRKARETKENDGHDGPS